MPFRFDMCVNYCSVGRMKALSVVNHYRNRSTVRHRPGLKGRCLAGLLVMYLSSVPTFAAQRADDYVDQAQHDLDAGNARAAEIQAKNALQIDPDNARALLLLARAYVDLEHPEAALRQLERARLMGADEASVLTLTAHAYLQQQNFTRLLDTVHNDETLPKAGQANVIALRGIAHLNLGHDDEAAEAFDEALTLDPQSIEGHIGAARMALRNRNLDRAEAHVRKVQARDPDNVDGLLVAGELARVRNQYVQSAAAFNQVLQRRPENTLAHLGLAAVLLDQGKLDEAGKHIGLVLHNWPNHPIGNYLRGELAYRAGNRDEAKGALKLALAVMPGHLPSHMLLGGIEFADDHPERAADHLSRYLAARPDQLPARKLLVASYLKLGQPKKALDALEPVLDRKDSDAQLHSLAGAAYMRMGDSSRAVEQYAKAVELDPEAASTRTELFVSLLVADSPEAADKQLRESIKLGADPVQASVMRTQLLLAQKSYDAALREALQLQTQAPDNPAGYNLAGVAYLGLSDRKHASDQFQQALKKSPDFALAAMNLAALALQSSDLKTARTYYQGILEHRPGHVGALMGLAELAQRAGSTEERLQWLEQARKANPAAVPPRMQLYDYRLQQGNMQAALDLAQEMAAVHPGDPQVLRALGIAEQGSNLIKRAVGTFRHLVELEPDVANAHALYADALASYGNMDAARKQLEIALKLDPKYLQARIGLGALEARAGNRQRALEIAAEVQQEHPQHSAGYELEGDLQAGAGDFSRAAEAFAQAYQRGSSARLAQKRFSALRKSGQRQQAYASLQQWLANHPDDIAIRVLLANSYQVDGRYEDAGREYQQVLKTAPNRADVMNNLAWTYLDRDLSKAFSWAEKAYALAPQNPAIIDTYGWIVFKQGDAQTGLGLLQEALLKAPQESGIRFHVAQALEQVGNYAEAHRHVKQILYTDPSFPEKAQAEAMLQRLERR